MTDSHVVFFEIFPWNVNFETGIELIDEQHKQLVDILNSLAAHLANRASEIKLNEIFEQLADYADYHFKSEEKIWLEYFGDDEWSHSHEETHGSFIEEVMALKNNSDNKSLDEVVYDVIGFLSKWLAYHILDTDKRMAIAVKDMQSGFSLEEAKADSIEKMTGFMRIVIETVLTMYESISTRTLDLMREKTLRLRAEEALKKSEERWKFVLEGASDNAWDWNIEDNVLTHSSDDRELFKVISNHLNDSDNRSVVHPSDAKEVDANLQAHIDGKTDFYINKHRAVKKDGSWSWILTRGKIVSRDKDGKPLRMVGTHTDITEREMVSIIHKNSTQAILICDAKNIIVNVNPAFCKITGYSKEEAIGQNPKFLAYGKHNELFYKEMWNSINRFGHWSGKFVNRRKNGEVFSEFININAVYDSMGNIDYLVAMFNDITEEEQNKKWHEEQKQVLEEKKELYSLVFENNVSPVLIIDTENNKFIACNDAVVRLLKCSSIEDIVSLSIADISPEFQPDGRRSDKKAEEMISLAVKKGSYTFEWVYLTKANEIIWAEVTLTQIVLEGKKVLHSVIRDFTSRKNVEEQLNEHKSILHHQANHDGLTGLPNRTSLNDRLSIAIEKAKLNHLGVAVLFIDLDHFKHINDSLGHLTGDEILKQVSKRIQLTISKENTLARFGGDEFVIVMEELSAGDSAALMAQKILDALSMPFYIYEHTLYISSSIGISLYPNDDETGDKLLMYADAAMYRAKGDGRNNFRFYSPEMTVYASEHITMETGIRKALRDEEFVVYYQPQINAKSGEFIGMEALVRWNHPTLGIISPANFIPLAEETGLIIPLDKWVMESAMSQIKKWYDDGLNPGVLAVNMSIKQLEKKDFMMAFKDICTKTGFKPQWLALEITESQIMSNPEDTIDILKQISQRGVQLAIDDFGTGYSSLSYLKQLPINKLKIDQSFIRGLPSDAEDTGITKTVIALAKSLNLSVIAEGVETEEQKDFLIQNGCENIQGYLFGKPVPADVMEKEWLRKF